MKKHLEEKTTDNADDAEILECLPHRSEAKACWVVSPAGSPCRRPARRSLGGGRTAVSSLAVCCALGAFALCPMTEAVTPEPDGGYPGGNPAEGQNALV